MYPEYPTSDAMLRLAASHSEDLASTLAQKTDKELAELSVSQGQKRLQVAAIHTLFKRHGADRLMFREACDLWWRGAKEQEILDAARSMGDAGGLA